MEVKKTIKAMAIFLISLILVIVLTGCGKNDKNNTNNNSSKNKSKITQLDLKTYSDSKSDNNIAIPFNATTNGYYVIDIKENGIGQALTLSDKTYKNEMISISNFYRAMLSRTGSGLADGSIKIHKLWNYDIITISTGYSKLPEDSSYIHYEILQKDNSNYLVHSKWKNTTSESYEIYIGNIDEDYFFKISSSELYSLDKTKELYEKLLNNSEVCYVEFDEQDNFLTATKSIKNTKTVDISSWRFFPDMIMEYFVNKGMLYKSSLQTEIFNHDLIGETVVFQKYEIDGKSYTAGFTIRKTSKEYYEKIAIEDNRKTYYSTGVCSDAKEIKLSGFDEAFLYTFSNCANLYVKSGNNYYKIDTGITYNNGSNNEELTDKVIKIMNQVFY